MTVYDVLRDQGGLIAGLLAFVAGILAYRAGLAQAKAVEKQNTELHRSERRHLARSSLVAVRLLDGVLAGINDCLDMEQTYVAPGVEVSRGDGQHIEISQAVASRQRIHKPSIEVIWEQLGQQNSEWIRNYMTLDRNILMLWNTKDDKDPTINSMLTEFRKLQAVVRSLRESLETDARRANDVLAEGQ